jgi:uncharacterized cupin superfamily protein
MDSGSADGLTAGGEAKTPIVVAGHAGTLAAQEIAMNARATELAAQLIRNFGAAVLQRQERAPLYDTLCAGLSDGTAASQLGAAVDIVPPGKRSCPYHYHLAQEEMFIVLEGSGSLRVAGEMLPLRAGDVIFVPPGPQYPHQLINTSDAPLKYLSISTQQQPEVCGYPDSGKTGVFAHGHRMMQREAANLDYWDGEP